MATRKSGQIRKVKSRVTKRAVHRKAERQSSTSRGFAEALFSSTQQRVLGLFFGQPDRSFSLSEIINLARAGTGAVQREVSRLAQSGLIDVEEKEGRKRYKANPTSPIFDELRSIIEKTIGVPDQLRAALQPLAERIHLAVLFGSVAKGTDTAKSDIDILIVSDGLRLDEVYAAVELLEKQLGRQISPTIYTSNEFATRRRSGNSFLTRVLSGKHTVLIGDDHVREGT
jgi:predicted nucleotidyltransferase